MKPFFIELTIKDANSQAVKMEVNVLQIDYYHAKDRGTEMSINGHVKQLAMDFEKVKSDVENELVKFRAA